MRDPLGFMLKASRAGDDVVRLRIGSQLAYLVCDLDGIGQILQQNSSCFGRSVFHDRMRPVLGEGLVTTDGETWRVYRQLMQSHFVRKRLNSLLPAMDRSVCRSLSSWAQLSADRKAIDIEQEMSRLTMDVFCQTILLGDEPQEIGDVGSLLVDLVKAGTPLLWLGDRWARWLLFPNQLALSRAKAKIDEIIRDLVAKRRGKSADSNDLLSLLLSTISPEMPEERELVRLRDHLITLFFAGYETTAITLAWLLYETSRDPNIMERLTIEAEENIGILLQGELDVNSAPFTQSVINEALRLYPPIWRLTRKTLCDTVISGNTISAGSTVIVSQYVTQRDPRFWSNPDSFDPERFLPGRHRPSHKFSFFPFGSGPRACLGYHLALMELHVIIMRIALSYRLSCVVPSQPSNRAFLTLRSRAGIRVRISPR